MKEFEGTLRGPDGTATCIVRVNTAKTEYMDDADVHPPLPDGEYDLQVNGVRRLAIRSGGVWKGFEI